MLRLLFLSMLSIALTACSQTNNSQTSVDTALTETAAVEISDTLCFYRYTGLQYQDTASLRMIFNGEYVSGQFANFPYQKDARIGTITGTKTGILIKGIWRYRQEGIDDSIGFEFKLKGNKLLQKKTNFDANTGREVLSDTSAFSIEFLQQDCQSADPRIKKIY